MNYCEREGQSSIASELPARRATERLSMFRAYGNMWKNTFNFKGRVGRNEYWLAFLGEFNVGILIALILGLVFGALRFNGVEISPTMYVVAIAVYVVAVLGWVSLRYAAIGVLMNLDKLTKLFYMPVWSWQFWVLLSACLVVLALVIVCWIPRISILVRRLHDSGKSIWFLLLLLVPFLGSDILFVCSFINSEDGDNRWGDNPKGVERNPYETKEKNKLITAVGGLLVNYENFKTCDSRRDYWLGMAGIGLILAELAFVTIRLSRLGMGGTICGLVCIIGFIISMTIPTLSGLVRRLHDTGRNGLIVILGLIVPVVIISLNRLVLFGVMESAMHYKVIPVIYECLKALDAVSILALIICVPNIIVMSLLDSKKTNNKWLEK